MADGGPWRKAKNPPYGTAISAIKCHGATIIHTSSYIQSHLFFPNYYHIYFFQIITNAYGSVSVCRCLCFIAYFMPNKKYILLLLLKSEKKPIIGHCNKPSTKIPMRRVSVPTLGYFSFLVSNSAIAYDFIALADHLKQNKLKGKTHQYNQAGKTHQYNQATQLHAMNHRPSHGH